MNRNKLNIKMDLLRASKTALDTDKNFDQEITKIFLDKAKQEFAFIIDSDKTLLDDIETYQKQMKEMSSDPLKRIRWGEKIMTVASMLSSN